MGDIVLSAGVRQNLLSLQSTADLMAQTQHRLATGKKVNSALDNPFNFFTSQSLNNRAGDLNSLLDAVGQAQKTLEAADHGISAITKLVESAKSVAKQAQQTTQATATFALAVTGNAAIAADTAAVATGTVAGLATTDVLNTLGLANGETITITTASGTASHTIVDATTETVATVIASLNGGTADITASVAGGNFVVTSNNTTDSIAVSGNGADSLLGTTTAAEPANATLGALTGNITVQVGAGAVQTIQFGTGAGQVTNRAELTAALGALTGVTATINGANQISITSTTDDTVTIGGTDAASFFAAADIGATIPTATVVTANQTRADLQDEYNEILLQIDALAGDASYNGVNLLNGDDLKVVFNEDGTSFLNITAVTFTATGLGLNALTADEFQTNIGTDAALANIDATLGTLRSQASNFGSKLGTVQTRQDFTKNLINTLETGADNLVLADTNEEGANMLALQTRQQLSTTALSLSAQADQAVLRLFG